MLEKGHPSGEALSDVIISNFMDGIHIAVEYPVLTGVMLQYKDPADSQNIFWTASHGPICTPCIQTIFQVFFIYRSKWPLILV